MARNIKTLFDLTGKTALVTGGSRGLGLQMAEALGEAGARIDAFEQFRHCDASEAVGVVESRPAA